MNQVNRQQPDLLTFEQWRKLVQMLNRRTGRDYSAIAVKVSYNSYLSNEPNQLVTTVLSEFQAEIVALLAAKPKVPAKPKRVPSNLTPRMQLVLDYLNQHGSITHAKAKSLSEKMTNPLHVFEALRARGHVITVDRSVKGCTTFILERAA